MLKPWRYWLASSKDMSIIGELREAKSRTLNVDNNKSGSAGFTINMDRKISEDIEPWKTCLITQRGYQTEAEWFWSGPVSSATKDFGAGTITVDAIGWFELLLHRLILDRVTYTDQDAASIVSALLDLANSQYPTYITLGTLQVSQQRTRTYEVDTNIGQEIQALAEIEAGYDWYVDPVTRKLNIYARRGADRTGCKWLFIADQSSTGKKSNKGNCTNVVEGHDGMTMVNDFRARGKFSTGSQASPWSQDHYGVLLQESQSLSDVSDQNILQAFAGAEILYRENPRITYTISPKPHTVSGVPVLFEDYDIGDTTYLTARRGNHRIDNQAIRIFGAGLSIDDSSGVENINSLRTADN